MRRPRIAESLLSGFIADRDLEEAILGDLTEEWNRRVADGGTAAANAWYWSQVLRSSPHLLRDWWLQQDSEQTLRILGRVALVLGAAVSLAAVTIVGMMTVAGGAAGQPSPDVTRAIIVASGAWAVIAGFVVAHRSADVPMVAAVLLGLSWLPTSLLTHLAHPAAGPPDWFSVVFPGLQFAFTVAGGVVATTLRGPRDPGHDSVRESHPSAPEKTMQPERNLFRLALRPLLVTAVLLLVPLVAMQFSAGMNWTLSDFVVMGILVAGSGVLVELALAKSDSLAYRAGAAVAVGAAFLLVWVNLAVGIIGSSANAANAMYAGVLAVGVVGSLAARFRAGGMARAMVATALAHIGVGMVALIAGWGSPFHVVGLTGMFAVLFLGSAWLFRDASRKHEGRAGADPASRSGDEDNPDGGGRGAVFTVAWLRSALGAVGLGLSWAVGWGIAGILAGIATGFLPDGHALQSMIDPWMALATPGFVGGLVFSAVFRIAGRRQTLDELSLPRACALGAATGLILGVLPFVLGTPSDAFPLWGLAVVTVGSTTLLCTLSACGSLTLARRVELAARTH